MILLIHSNERHDILLAFIPVTKIEITQTINNTLPNLAVAAIE